jgi:hypothetical protein
MVALCLEKENLALDERYYDIISIYQVELVMK